MLNDSSSESPVDKKTVAKRYAWSPFAAVLVVIGSFLIVPTFVQIVLSFVPNILGWDEGRAHDWGTGSPLANFLFVLFTEILTVAVVYAFVRRHKIAFRVAAALGKPKLRDVGYAVLGLLIYFGIFLIVYTLVTHLFSIDTDQKQALGFEQGVSGAGLWLAFFSLVILPPIAEEIMFRGFFYGTLRGNRIKKWPAILVTTTLFASLHLFGAASGGLLWAAFIDVFALSLVLCYLREQNGTIWASMGVHALKNGFVFLNLFIIHAH
jgi:membrane protease YdiL (CAAX protease family)